MLRDTRGAIINVARYYGPNVCLLLARNYDLSFHVACHVVDDRLVVVVLLVPPYRVGEVGLRQKRGPD